MGNFYPFLLFLIVLPRVLADLSVGFYQTSCPGAESLVRQLVQRRFAADRSVTAALLRMHFHDCFVRGCDASILIDSTTRTESEKEAGANLTVREFELIDQIKAALESACPNTVSCADVITLATRDAVFLAGGPNYTIPTGRRDGLASNAEDVILPDPDIAISDALPFFTSRGLTLADMVTLMGAHTIGVSHCSFFSDRLTDFQGTGRPDPSMDPGLASRLSKTCASQTSDPTVFLDQNTSFVVDNEFYKQIGLKKGILKIDQELTLDRSCAGLVSGFATNPSGFKQSFGNAMVKLGGVQVLVGNAGEIRKNCRVFNPKKTTPPPPPPMKKAPPPPPPIKTTPPPPPPIKKAPPPPPPIKKAPPPPPPMKKAPPPPPMKKRAPPPPPPKKKRHHRVSKKKSPPRHKN